MPTNPVLRPGQTPPRAITEEGASGRLWRSMQPREFSMYLSAIPRLISTSRRDQGTTFIQIRLLRSTFILGSYSGSISSFPQTNMIAT